MFWVLNQITGLDEHGARTFSRVKEEFELDDAPAWNPPIRQAPGEQQEAFRDRLVEARESESEYTTSVLMLEWVREKIEDRFDLAKGGGFPPQFSGHALTLLETIREFIRIEKEAHEGEVEGSPEDEAETTESTPE